MELIGKDALKTVSDIKVRQAVQDALRATDDANASRAYVVVEITKSGAHHVASRGTEQVADSEQQAGH